MHDNKNNLIRERKFIPLYWKFHTLFLVLATIENALCHDKMDICQVLILFSGLLEVMWSLVSYHGNKMFYYF